MEILLLFVIVIVMATTEISKRENAVKETNKNKIDAIRNERMIYEAKTPNGRIKKTVSGNREVRVVRGEVIDLKTGKTLYNEKEAKAERIRQYAKKKAIELGYDFYPTYTTNRHTILDGNNTGPLLQEIETGKYFYMIYNPRFGQKSWKKYYDIDQDGFIHFTGEETEKVYDDTKWQMRRILSEAKKTVRLEGSVL